MPTIVDDGFPTLQNVLKTLAPDGSVETDMAEVMTEKLDILDDIPWKEGNLPTGEQITAELALPTPTWRMYNQGIKPTKGETEQYVETCGMLEDYSDVDRDVANFNGNAVAYRARQNRIKIRSFSKELARALFYESAATNPERVHGLATRYGGVTGYRAGAYVLPKGTLSGVNCRSVWLINWDFDTVYGIYPKGHQGAGLSNRDLGERTLTKADGTQLQVLTSHLQQKCGFAVADYRRIVRMQWDPDDAAFADSAKGMYLALQEMLDTVFDLGPNAAIYMDRVSAKKLNAQMASNSVNFLEYVEAGKRRVRTFLGTTLRITDALVPESPVAA